MVRSKIKPQHHSVIAKQFDSNQEKNKKHVVIVISDSDNEEDKTTPLLLDSSSREGSFCSPNKRKRYRKDTERGKLFNKFLKESVLSIQINKEVSADMSVHCFFGELQMETDNSEDILASTDMQWLFLNENADQSILYCTVYQNSEIIQESSSTDTLESVKYCHILGVVDIELWKVLGIKRYFQIIYDNFSDNILTVKVYLMKSAVHEIASPSEATSSFRNLMHVVHYFYDILIPDIYEDSKCYLDPDFLYKSVQELHRGKTHWDQEVQHQCLIPDLRPYQKAAVKWMLSQEMLAADDCKNQLHPLYIELIAKDGMVLYYNRFGGYFIKQRPVSSQICPGGILADEMGLGKTVEILACILNNPRNKFNDVVYNDSYKIANTHKSDEAVQNNSSGKDLLGKDGCKYKTENEYSNENIVPVPVILENKNGNDLLDNIKSDETTSLYLRQSSVDDTQPIVACSGINPFDTFQMLTCSDNSNRPMMQTNGAKDYDVDWCSKRISIRKRPFVNYQVYFSDDSAEEISSDIYEKKKRSSTHARPKCSSIAISDDTESEETRSPTLKLRKSRRKKPEPNFYISVSDDSVEERESESDLLESQSGATRCKTDCQIPFNKEQSISSGSKTVKSKVRFDPEKEISKSSIKSVIDRLILEKVWDNVLADYKKEGSYKEYRKFLRIRVKNPLYLMTLKERLNLHYLNSIESFSALSALTPGARIKNFFDTKVKQKSFFECVCGHRDAEIDDNLTRIQCTVCKLYQHADCVHYDLLNAGREEYICPHCWSEQVPVVSGATLIVSPSSISYQWEEEIQKHISEKSLKVLIYCGVAVHGYIQPKTLSSYDIVITTYEVLRRELSYVDLPHSNSEAGRRFRHPKRFMAVPSPLPCIEWWRVCLDEAQMVECITTKTAEMCHRLRTQNKWCVTGTPIQKTLNDIQGLLMFLEVDPYGFSPWWQRCLYIPYCQGERETLHKVLGRYMWRTSKKDVLNELGIPPAEDKVHWLKFTPVEEHFYKRLHAKCLSEAMIKLNKFPDKTLALKSLDRQTFSSLLQPLLRLRQACNHPQVVRGHFTQINRKTLTMEHLLENLIKKTQLEAEEALRVIVASLNGLAAIHIIREEFCESVFKYREVLRILEDEGKDLKTDLLQKIHTVHNLSEVLHSQQDKITERTLRDGNIGDEYKTLREQYLKQYPQKISEAKSDCVQQTNIIEDVRHRDRYCSDWWLLAAESVDHEFIQELKAELLSQYSRFQEHQCIIYNVEAPVQLMRLLKAEIKKIDIQRAQMIREVKLLSEMEDYESLLNGAIACHLRPVNGNVVKCILCVKHEIFENFEETLFFMKDETIGRYTDTSKEIAEKVETYEALKKGNWGMSEVEKILKYLQTKTLGRADLNIQEDSQKHFQILQHMKKEFKLYRIWWRTIYDYVSALDEVSMAILRFRLRLPGEEVQESKKKSSLELSQKQAPIYIVDETELPQLEFKLKSEKIINQNDLRSKLGQILYLNNLKVSDLGRKGGFNPEHCPICKNQLGEKWAVLQCGHCFCIDCIGVFLSKFPHNLEKGRVKCPMCRQSTLTREISYIDTTITPEDEENFKIHGSLSTKIEGVVRVVLKIKTTDPCSKVLVFSTWTDVLDIIADGLTQNGITFRILNSNKKFQANLSSFKSKQEITVLLMPLSFGANGLNLVEAQHVLLVEPILNPAAEVQAIGRIHRIGQTRSTTVHRFIVSSTIEERMYQVLSPKVNAVDNSTITIENLRQIFSQVGQEECTDTEEQ